ncbi:LRR and CARD domains-containing protein 3) (Nucleotide-binding oligomerization domain protein 3) [Durusdinium trenchii]|uniref:LRR and CARD domains-containing protein 3 (Nucleotide-binding oligomerization domain protein 3 n=1 Tax=Durusdinium trenchii TaxID=1381693 RepID=A0ABP0KQ40_9DINO
MQNVTRSTLGMSSRRFLVSWSDLRPQRLKNRQTNLTLQMCFQDALEFRTGLADLLKKNSHPTKLNFWCGRLGDAEVEALADALKKNTAITMIDLTWNKIGDAGAKALAEMLKVNTTLRVLGLGANQIGDVGFEALADALQHNKTLSKLILDTDNSEAWNRIRERLKANREAAVEALAEALKHNKTLPKLDLATYGFGVAEVQVLAEALQFNTTLTNLNLSGLQIGDESAEALAAALRHNKTLTKLHLGANQIGRWGFEALANALQHNKTLTNLDFNRDHFGHYESRHRQGLIHPTGPPVILSPSPAKMEGEGGGGVRRIAAQVGLTEILKTFDARRSLKFGDWMSLVDAQMADLSYASTVVKDAVDWCYKQQQLNLDGNPLLCKRTYNNGLLKGMLAMPTALVPMFDVEEDEKVIHLVFLWFLYLQQAVKMYHFALSLLLWWKA